MYAEDLERYNYLKIQAELRCFERWPFVEKFISSLVGKFHSCFCHYLHRQSDVEIVMYACLIKASEIVMYACLITA